MVLFGMKEILSFKYFIAYKSDSKKFMPLCIMLPKISAYGKFFDEIK